VADPLGSVVARALGLRVEVLSDPTGRGFGGLAGLALRENPLRAHLVVSRVLAKHIAAPAATVVGAARDLAALVAAALRAGPPPLVLGFAETATGLGLAVADALGAAVAGHSTRRPGPALLGFREEHSHAADQTLQLPRAAFDDPAPLVLVDDELTTGATALNVVAALHGIAPRDSYVIATLLDLRPEGARAAFAERAGRLGVRVEVVALLDGVLRLPDDVLARAALARAVLARAVLARQALAAPAVAPPAPVAAVVGHPGGLAGPASARLGLDPAARAAMAAGAGDLARALPLSGPATLVLGTEELMAPAVLLAVALGPGAVVQSTTRSPVLALDLDGYAVRRVLTAPAPDDPTRATRVHNLGDPLCPGGSPAYDDVVLLVDTPVAAALPLAEVLRGEARGAVRVVTP